MGLNFEQVWAALMENRQQLKEAQQEADRRMKETDRLIRELRDDGKETDRQLEETDRLFRESKAETDRLFQESRAQTDRTIATMSRELNQAIGKLGNRFGELIEHLVSPNVLEKFTARGYTFSRTNTRVKYKDPNTGRTLAEVDVLLENGDCMLAVEIKADPSIEDVNDHINRMETLRVYADAHHDKREYLGAIAGGIIGDDVKNYALKKGLYVLEQSGDTVHISATPESWKPQRW
jgi:hypothetical protein